MRIVMIADSHGGHPEIPDGDMLIHAGDLTMEGKLHEVVIEGQWLRRLPHKYKIIVAGNHDFLFQKNRDVAVAAMGGGLTYMEDKMVEIEGIRIYGSPWQPEFQGWAFNLDRGAPLRKVWSKIPDQLDILITHGPPKNILDYSTLSNEHVGDEELLERLRYVEPKLHVFGHIHPGHGAVKAGQTLFVNAALGYHLEHKPVVIDWDNGNVTLVST